MLTWVLRLTFIVVDASGSRRCPTLVTHAVITAGIVDAHVVTSTIIGAAFVNIAARFLVAVEFVPAQTRALVTTVSVETRVLTVVGVQLTFINVIARLTDAIERVAAVTSAPATLTVSFCVVTEQTACAVCNSTRVVVITRRKAW